MILKTLEPLYHLASSFKNFLYGQKIIKSVQLKASVISVGNLSFGGTGKTPCIELLANELCTAFDVAIVCRSYKASLTAPAEVKLTNPASAAHYGDEACYLKSKLAKCRVWAGRKKYATAQLADLSGPDIILIDDGFSHRKLNRDFDLVLFDATQPSDYLRERMQSLNRAQAVLITKINLAPASHIKELIQKLKVAAPNLTDSIFYAESQTSLAVPISKPLFLFCGIAKPESIKASLQILGYSIVHSEFFSDHYQYDINHEKKIWEKYSEMKKNLPDLALVTTAKDQIKLTNPELVNAVQIAQHKMILTESDKVGLIEKIRSNL